MTPGLVPIVVAITGHRDIPAEDIDPLITVVTNELNKIAQAHPHSPRLMISGLAEGADRIVAQCALSLGWRLGAILPLTQQAYESDFAGEASITEFRGLLGQAAWVRVIDDGCAVRPDCYREQGLWMARYAQTLIAIWDGKEVGLTGGTGDVVRLFREGVLSDEINLPDAGPVIHIKTRRSSSTELSQSEINVTLLPPNPAGLDGEGELERWGQILKRIDDFNRDALIALNTNKSAIEQTRRYLNQNQPIDEDSLSNSALNASWLFAVADTISFDTQKMRHRQLILLLAMGAAALVLGQLYSGPFPNPILLILAVLMGGMAYVVLQQNRRMRIEARYLDYRALAEACRTQYFWKYCYLNSCAGDFFLRDQRDELEWIRQSILTTELGVADKPETNISSRLLEVRNCWIDDQKVYFSGQDGTGGKAKLNQHLSDKWASIAKWLLLAAVLITITTAILHGTSAMFLKPALIIIIPWLPTVYGLLFAGAGFSKVYQEIKAFSEQANRYQRMALLMFLARRRIDAALDIGDLASANQVVFEIGRSALDEVGEWLLIHRDRPLTVPLG